jgi:nucleotide-binding universal stress UspA family protein
MPIHALDLAPISGGEYGEQHRADAPVILVGYDGSPASRRAIEYAVERAGSDGRVVVVHAAGPGHWWFGAPSYQREDSDYVAAGESLLADLVKHAPSGAPIQTSLVEGPTPKALMEAARECSAAEVVVGAHGSDPEKSGLGSVPVALLRSCDRPVVVVPAGKPRP